MALAKVTNRPRQEQTGRNGSDAKKHPTGSRLPHFNYLTRKIIELINNLRGMLHNQPACIGDIYRMPVTQKKLDSDLTLSARNGLAERGLTYAGTRRSDAEVSALAEQLDV